MFFWFGVVICKFLDRIYRHISKSCHFAKPLPPPLTRQFLETLILTSCFELATSLFYTLTLISLSHPQMPKVLYEKLDVQQVWKPPWLFPIFLAKKPDFAKYDNRLHFFQGFFKETWLCKIWKVLTLYQRFFQRNLTVAKHEIHLVFSKVLLETPNLVLCFCLRFLSFWF